MHATHGTVRNDFVDNTSFKQSEHCGNQFRNGP